MHCARATPPGRRITATTRNAFYQIPVKARRLPIVMLHGAGQFSRTWESTPGREGFQNIFLRRGFSTYVVAAAARRRRPGNGGHHRRTDTR